MMDKKAIGRMLKYMRQSAGMTQEDMAKELKIAPTTLSGYETEYSKANFETVQVIAQICEFDIIMIDRNSQEEFKIEKENKK